MQVSVETTGELGRKMTIAVPADEVEKEISSRLRRLAKTARLPGFRPGKAPLKVIEARYGSQVLQEVAGQLIERSLREALSRESLQPAGGTEIDPKSIGRGKDLEYVARFDVFPEIRKLDLTGLTIERPVCEVTDTDVEQTLESMRKQYTDWRPLDRPAQSGDRLRIDFHGTLDGAPFRGGDAENYSVMVGSDTMLPEFAQGLDGVSSGDEPVITVTYPDNHHEPEVAGKQAEFRVKVLEVAEPVLPEIDAEFVKLFGVQNGGVEKLREDVRENLSREMAERINRTVRDRVMQALIDANQVELPAKLVAEEVQRMAQANQELLRQQAGVAAAAPDPAELEPQARRRVALGLIVYEVVKALNLRPDKDQMRAKVTKMAGSYENPDAFVQWYYSDQQRVQQLEAQILEEQVVEKLLETATVTEQAVTVDGLMSGAGSTNI